MACGKFVSEYVFRLGMGWQQQQGVVLQLEVCDVILTQLIPTPCCLDPQGPNSHKLESVSVVRAEVGSTHKPRMSLITEIILE